MQGGLIMKSYCKAVLIVIVLTAIVMMTPTAAMADESPHYLKASPLVLQSDNGKASTDTIFDSDSPVDLSDLTSELALYEQGWDQPYYYRQLNTEERALYVKMLHEFGKDGDIIITGADAYTFDQMHAIAYKAYDALRYDDPWFNVYAFVMSFENVEDYSIHFILNNSPEYKIEKSKAAFAPLVDACNQGDSRFEKLLIYAHYLNDNVAYDYDIYFLSNILWNDTYTLPGVVLEHLAVCDGIAQATKALCDELGIPCLFYVASSSIGMTHAWNFIQMEDGKWYSFDGTNFTSDALDCLDDEQLANGQLLEGSVDMLKDNRHDGTKIFGLDDVTVPTLSKESYQWEGTIGNYDYYDGTFSYDEGESTFFYSPNEDGTTCTVTGYRGVQAGDLVIPDKIDGLTVNAIGEGAFYRCKGFTGGVFISDTVESIGACAFFQCTGLTGSLDLPENLVYINDAAFAFCEGLSGQLVFPDAVEYIGGSAFYRCEGLSGDLILPAHLNTLGEYAFSYCHRLDGKLFVPDNVIMPTNSAIADSSISSVEVDDSNQNYSVYDGILYSSDGKKLILCPPGKGGSFSILESTEVIGNYAFANCDKLTGGLVLPAGLKQIGDHSFEGCMLSGPLVLPEGLEYIGAQAFSISFDSYENKRPGFVGDLIIPDSVTEIGDAAFMGNDFGGELVLSKSLKKIEKSFIYCQFSNPLVIPDGVEEICEYAFSSDEDRQMFPESELVLPSGLKTIGSNAFRNYKVSGTLIVPDSVESIGDEAFSNCTASAVYVPDSAETFGYECFNGVDDALFFVKMDSAAEDYLLSCGKNVQYTCIYGHVFGDTYSIDKQPTCTEQGLQSYHCRVCGTADDQSTEEISALGHDYAPVVTEPTCTEAGHTTWTCSRCGDSHIDSEVPALEHDYVTTVIAPTCTEVGCTMHTCSRCGDSYTDSEVPAKGHSWSSEYAVDISATCSKEGSESIHCEVCGASREGTSRAIPKVEHKWGEWETVLEPIYGGDGSRQRSCSVCGETETASIPALERTDITGCAIAGVVDKKYDGSEQTQKVVVSCDGKVLTEGEDYTISYEDNVNAGMAKVFVMGIGAYEGSSTQDFLITKRFVKLTSVDGEKAYDGTALTKNAQTDVTVSGDGFADGEGATYSITGSQTEIGSSPNVFTYMLNSNTRAGNYDIVKAEGTLTVKALPQHTLSIKYVYADGKKAKDPYVKSYVEGAKYDVAVPAIAGYEATVGGVKASSVKGTMGKKDVAVTVMYTATVPSGKGVARSHRLAGDTALDTMSKIVDAGSFPKGGTVVLATSEGYWDALTAAGVAGLADAPVLMTNGSSLSAETRAQIAKLKPKTIVICGGPAAVSRAVESQARSAAGGAAAIRCQGDTATGTACKIFENGSRFGSWSDTAFVCTNAGYWDALAAAPISYAKHMPIFLTEGASSISAETLNAMRAGGIKRVFVVGGKAAITPAVESQLKGAGITVSGRLWGNTAIETSEAVATFGIDSMKMSANNLGVATSSGYWDALAGAALCGRKGSVLVLVDGPQAHSVTCFARSEADSIADFYIFGGTAAVSRATENAAVNAAK